MHELSYLYSVLLGWDATGDKPPVTIWGLSCTLFFYCMKTCIVTCPGHFQFNLWGLIFRNCPWNWSSYEYLMRSSGTDLIIEFILIILWAPDISDSHWSTKKLNHLQLWSASKHSQHLPHEIDFSFTNNVGFLKYLETWKGLAQNKLLGSSY